MKFLIHSNGPHVSTGYGVQTALLVERLKAAGHAPAVSCTYGQQGATGTWRGVTLYPVGYEVNGNDIIHNHAAHHFAGDDGWVVTLLDVWALTNPLEGFNVAAWCPVDHFPAPPDVIKFFRRTDATPIAMSRYGEKLLFEAGLDPVYIPLAIDTTVMRPTPYLDLEQGRVSARELFDIPNGAFCVGMVAMNKGWARDRKGFNEALRAFGIFWRSHPEAILYLHAEKYGGAEGINLVELATHAAVPEHTIRWVDQYAYRLGVPGTMMAAAYTAMDVLLAPSHGEGFCVPLLEAQACGTPVIATDFSAQPELVGAGWLVSGQPEWDPAQHASYLCPSIVDIVDKLEEAFVSDLAAMQAPAVEFAAGYDADAVFEGYWQPFLDSLEAPADTLPLQREPIPTEDGVAVIVPAMRPENLTRLVESFYATNDGSANLYLVHDNDLSPLAADVAASGGTRRHIPTGSDETTTYAEKVNAAYEQTEEPWLFLCGDDVEFHPGWIDEARMLSDRFDVIGTNDTLTAVKNPDVAAGRHADHFFVRRAYVDEYGACLDGPKTLAPECYRHWYCDKEIVGLAKARGVFTPCLASVVEHHHPGYDNQPRDPVYLMAIDSAEDDQRTFRSRLPLIEMQRTHRGKS